MASSLMIPRSFDKAVKEITDGNGFDIAIEAVGLPSTFQNCIDAACFGGKVVVIGVGKKTWISILHCSRKKNLMYLVQGMLLRKILWS